MLLEIQACEIEIDIAYTFLHVGLIPILTGNMIRTVVWSIPTENAQQGAE